VATVTVGQVLALGRKHGFTDPELVELYAVTMTEAGNRTDARQAGGKGRGLVQIDLGSIPPSPRPRRWTRTLRWPTPAGSTGSPG